MNILHTAKNHWITILLIALLTLATLFIARYSSEIRGAVLTSTGSTPVTLTYDHALDISGSTVPISFDIGGLSATNKISSIVINFTNFPSWLTINEANISLAGGVISNWELDSAITDFTVPNARIRLTGSNAQPYATTNGDLFTLTFTKGTAPTNPTAVGISADFVLGTTFTQVSTGSGTITFSTTSSTNFQLYPRTITSVAADEVTVVWKIENIPSGANISSITLNITNLPTLATDPTTSIVVLNGFTKDTNITSWTQSNNTVRVLLTGNGTTPYMTANGDVFRMNMKFTSALTSTSTMTFNSTIVNNFNAVDVVSQTVNLAPTTQSSTNIADIDEDGCVDMDDFTHILNNWKKTGTQINPVRTDIIVDSIVQIKDFAKFLSEFGWKVTPSTVCTGI